MAKSRRTSRRSKRRVTRKSHSKKSRRSKPHSKKQAARRARFAKVEDAMRTITSSCGKRSKTACGKSPNCRWNKRVGCVAKKGLRGLRMLNLD